VFSRKVVKYGDPKSLEMVTHGQTQPAIFVSVTAERGEAKRETEMATETKMATGGGQISLPWPLGGSRPDLSSSFLCQKSHRRWAVGGDVCSPEVGGSV
jgi:hypothetical protein